MTVTPLCPNCHGDCCVNKRGTVVDHGSVLALHSCPDCLDGFAPANPLCATCGGLCCRISASLHTRVSHRSVTHTTHECDCLDGCAHPIELAAERLAALLDAERENTALRVEVERLSGERAAVVAWLYRQHYDDTAERIERGEHCREDILRPTVETLQQSALDLLDRMLACGEHPHGGTAEVDEDLL